jgi:hypothetical protein
VQALQRMKRAEHNKPHGLAPLQIFGELREFEAFDQKALWQGAEFLNRS